MKKLLCLILAVAVVALLFQSGTLTVDRLADWGRASITWTIDALGSLLEKLNAVAPAADTSGVLLVNAGHPLPEDYSPGELVRLFDQKRSFLLARDDLYVTPETFDAMNRMFSAAEAEGLNGFIVTSAYRDRAAQQRIFDESEAGLAQTPGCSEHETGLAFDVTAQHDSGSFEDTSQCQWLLAHCHEYGFIQRYPEGKESITGVKYEPWHYRYVGAELAQAIHASGLTLEEYMKQ